jgi:hypothetical protein
MKGKSLFTKEEANRIEQLIKQKLVAIASEQKGIRAKIRRLGFYASDFGIGGGYNVEDFRRVAVIEGNCSENNLLSKNENQLEKDKSKPLKNLKSKRTEKDETIFFSAFNRLLGEEWLLSKSIQKPISSADVFLSDDFRDYAFPKSIENNFEELLEVLKSNYSFSSKSLSHYLDGLIKNHPIIGSRIIEFDEEQHFTPAFRNAIMVQSKSIDQKFLKFYLEILTDVNSLNVQTLKKHRINSRFQKIPKSYNQFLEALKNERVSGYIEPKENGFEYLGGRIAQRAYYDCLRNVAHLSSKNKGLQPIIRFPKKFFEDASKKRFGAIDNEDLMELTQLYLKKNYGLNIKATK